MLFRSLATICTASKLTYVIVFVMLSQDFLTFNDQCDRKQSLIDLLDEDSPSGFSILKGLYPICWRGLTTLLGVSNCLLQTVQQTPNARHRPFPGRPSRLGIASECLNMLSHCHYTETASDKFPSSFPLLCLQILVNGQMWTQADVVSNWLRNFAQFHNYQPDTEAIHLPFGTKRQVWYR